MSNSDSIGDPSASANVLCFVNWLGDSRRNPRRIEGRSRRHRRDSERLAGGIAVDSRKLSGTQMPLSPGSAEASCWIPGGEGYGAGRKRDFERRRGAVGAPLGNCPGTGGNGIGQSTGDVVSGSPGIQCCGANSLQNIRFYGNRTPGKLLSRSPRSGYCHEGFFMISSWCTVGRR